MSKIVLWIQSTSLRTKLIVLSVILALIPLGFAGTKMIRIMRDELISSANEKLMKVVSKVTQDIENYMRIPVLQLIKEAVESEDLGREEITSIMKESMKNITDVVALQISVEGVPSPLLIIQDEFSETLRNVGDDPYQVMQIPLDKIAALLGEHRLFIGDTKFIPNAKVWLITVIFPLDPAKFSGRNAAISAKLNLASMIERIKNEEEINKVLIYVINAEGKKLLDPQNTDLSERKIVQTVKDLLNSTTRTGTVETYIRPSGEKMLGAYGFPPFLEWGIIAEENETDAYVAVRAMEKNLIFWAFIGFIIAVVGAVIFSISLTNPLRKLTNAASLVAEGDLHHHIEIRATNDEIGELSRAFNKMVDDLAKYIEELKHITQLRAKEESQQQQAREIQQSFLPKTFPESDKIDAWGKCEPALGVGGDYFDFFQINNESYGMVIGDVTGKGVSAALFMAVSRTLFRILSSQQYSPEVVLMEFNNRLVELDQGSNMFITMFYGVFDTQTGRLLYSTAGHNMPYIRTQTDNKFRMLPGIKTMLAGMMEDVEMELAEIQLQSGDTIVLYTDGMVEAQNKEQQEFGEDRLGELIDQYAKLPANEMCSQIIEEVKLFQADMPQFDDMTMFIMKVK